jgi:hypothetical protein
MAAMVRKQVYIEPAQDEFLKQRSRELGVTEAELIRQGIATLARTPAGPPFDPQAWTAVLESMEVRARLPTVSQGRTWRREDLYEGRVGRVPG